MTTYSLATFRVEGRACPVMEVNGQSFSIAEHAPDLLGGQSNEGLMPLFRDWPASHRRLSALAAEIERSPSAKQAIRAPADPTDILAPLLYPSKVICTGANYRDHLDELGFTQFDKSKARTPFFLKPPRTAVVGCGRSVSAPRGVTQFDWEIELTAVIGIPTRYVSVERALDHVAAYTIGIDLSARDLLLHPDNVSKMDVFGGKGFDHSCPLGPKVVPAEFVGDPQALQMTLSVNGTVKQNASTSLMIWSIAEQIAQISSVMTLEAGDVILTGTPAGAAYPHGPFLKLDDQIRAEIEHLGVMELQIVA